MDGLEQELKGVAQVVRVDIQGGVGQELAARLKALLVPTFILFDAQGQEVWRQSATFPSRERILREVRRLTP